MTLILLSAGGTGGHMSPAAALGRELLSRGFRVEVITDPRGMKFEPMFPGIKMHVIPSGTLGRGIAGKIKGLTNLAAGGLKATQLVRKLNPALVVGFGGYPSVPGVWAAQRLGIPTILHEQNAVLGKANALLAGKAKSIALSWPSAEEKYKNTVVTGNPVRAEIAALARAPYPVPEPGGALRIFVVGGSLGAKVFSTVVPEAFSRLPASEKSRLDIVQQCRAEDTEQVKSAYAQAGIKAEIAPFFHDVPQRLERAHLLICRSGASTVAEAAAAGRPAIFVPYPHHKDQQQKRNAEAVAQAGGGWTVLEPDFTPESLFTRIETFLQDPAILSRAAEQSRACGKPDATRKLGDLVAETVSKKNERTSG